MAQTTTPPDGGPIGPLYTALRVFGIVVLALMVLSIVYSGWIALENWGTISV